MFRLAELEGELSGAREKVAQLQVEKEKALADLNNIRKINRTIEKSVIYTYVHTHAYNVVHTCNCYVQYVYIHVLCSSNLIGVR